MKKTYLIILISLVLAQTYAQKCSKDIKGTVYIDTKYTKAENATVNVKDISNNVVKSFITKKDGTFLFNLNCNMKYKIEATHSNLQPVEFVIITRVNKDIRPKNIFLQSLKVDKEISQPTPKKTVQKKKGFPKGEISYGNNKWDVSDRVLTEINQVIELMEVNPNLSLYFESHTDKRGDKKDNLALTKKRLASLIEYVISAGVSADRVTGNAYGETRPFNDCGFMGKKCSQKEYLLNRRTTFALRKN